MRERRNSPPLEGCGGSGRSPPPPFMEAGGGGERVTWKLCDCEGRESVEREIGRAHV